MNEVLANRANELLGYQKGKNAPVHPNDDVNKSQSSNDVIPTAMHLACISQITKQLLPAITLMEQTLTKKITEFKEVIKVGRTHLQDAVPIPLAMEFAIYKEQLMKTKTRARFARALFIAAWRDDSRNWFKCFLSIHRLCTR